MCCVLSAALLRLAKLVLDADLSAPCDALVLFPESGGNMHRFAAATACAVLDVLGPPYSGDRDCTYYQDLPYRRHIDDTGNAMQQTLVPILMVLLILVISSITN